MGRSPHSRASREWSVRAMFAHRMHSYRRRMASTLSISPTEDAECPRKSPPSSTKRLADRLSAEFHRCFSDFEASDDLFAPNTFFDLLPPMWRFQFEGPGEAFTAQLRSIARRPGRDRDRPHRADDVRLRDRARRDPAHSGRRDHARRIHLCEVRDGHICAGHDLLQRRMGRRAACASRRRSADDSPVTSRPRRVHTMTHARTKTEWVVRPMRRPRAIRTVVVNAVYRWANHDD